MIEIYQNNNVLLYISFTIGAEPYNVPAGQIIKFSVKKSVVDTDEEILIQKIINGDGGANYVIELTKDDTNLPIGVYWYDFKDTTNNKTLQGPAKFIINEVVLQNE